MNNENLKNLEKRIDYLTIIAWILIVENIILMLEVFK
jgi:hypothetical protein